MPRPSKAVLTTGKVLAKGKDHKAMGSPASSCFSILSKGLRFIQSPPPERRGYARQTSECPLEMTGFQTGHRTPSQLHGARSATTSFKEHVRGNPVLPTRDPTIFPSFTLQFLWYFRFSREEEMKDSAPSDMHYITQQVLVKHALY